MISIKYLFLMGNNNAVEKKDDTDDLSSNYNWRIIFFSLFSIINSSFYSFGCRRQRGVRQGMESEEEEEQDALRFKDNVESKVFSVYLHFRIVQKKSVNSVMNERMLLSNLRHS